MDKKKKNKNTKQELSLEIELEKYNKEAEYFFNVISEYTNKNISFEYYAYYKGDIYNKNIFYMSNYQANQLFLDIEKSIINNIKNLNPIIKEKQSNYNKNDILYYKIDLLFNDTENVYPKLNIEKIFNSIISILKNRNIKLEEKHMNELNTTKRIKILLNNKKLKVEIEKKYNNLNAIINYNGNVSNKFKYGIQIEISIGETDNVSVKEYNSFTNDNNVYEMFDNYKDYFGYIELLNSNKILDNIINPIIQNKNVIEKTIKEYDFKDALIVIDRLTNGYYNNNIINYIERTLFNYLISYFKRNLNDSFDYIEC